MEIEKSGVARNGFNGESKERRFIVPEPVRLKPDPTDRRSIDDAARRGQRDDTRFSAQPRAVEAILPP